MDPLHDAQRRVRLQVDDHFLAQWHLPTGSQGGILFKSSFGDLANLRWDIATDNLAYVYK